MIYEAVIGLEIHIQLNTETKLFSSSVNIFGRQANCNTNELDLGYPGVLPALNGRAVQYAAMLGFAIDAHVNPHAFFMRKNYFYPDLPKGYQISQLDDAIIQGGQVVIIGQDGIEKTIRINRGQLEEDAGKSVHDIFIEQTAIDLNRAGVPLIELVSEPDISSAKEAVSFMRQIHHLVRYLGISDGNMQEGSFRCDANVSIREANTADLNSRVELKNINSFRFVEQAINIEIERQIELVKRGKQVVQETRLFDPERQETRAMRSKEEANDYRYFPDPDLLPLHLSSEALIKIQDSIPELPAIRFKRLKKQYNLDEESLSFILQDLATADYFDELVKLTGNSKMAINWMQGELTRLLNEYHVDISRSKVSASDLSSLLKKIEDGTLSTNIAKRLLPQMWEEQKTVEQLIDEQGISQITDNSQIQLWVEEVISEYPEQVGKYHNGQQKMLGFFVGQVLKKSGGKADPKLVNSLLKHFLGSIVK